MDYNKVKDQFGSWGVVMKKFIESDKFDDIFRYLKHQSKDLKKTVIPASKDLFKSFQVCDRTQLRAIVVLMDPYPSFKKIDGIETMVASGIPMDCSNTDILQPTLDMWYDAIADCHELDPDMDMRKDLTYLLEEQHVLLLNSSLSVEKDKPGSHAATWAPFMEYFFTELDNWVRGVPIVLCGKQAQQYEKYINSKKHYILKVEHPMAAKYAQRQWDYKNMFHWINEIIKKNNGESEGIEWYPKKTYGEKRPTWKELSESREPSQKRKIDEEWEKGDMPWD